MAFCFSDLSHDLIICIDETDGHKADSPTLISPSGAMTGVQNLPCIDNVSTRSLNFPENICLAIRIQLLHFGAIVFQLASG